MTRILARIFLVTLAIAQGLDVLSTNVVLASVPDAIEANPMMRLAMDHLGGMWWLPKAVCAVLFLYIALHVTKARRVSVVGLGVFASFYVAVVAQNLCYLL